MYYWLNGLLGGALYPYLLGLMWSFLLERRWKKCPVWAMAVVLMLLTQPAGLIRSQSIGNFLFQLMGIVQILLMIAFLIFGFQDKLWKKILVFFTFLPCGFIGEFLGVTIMQRFGIYYQFTFASKEMFLLQTVSITIDICFYTVITIIWYRIFKRQTLPRHTWIFLLFPISQLLMMWSLTDQEMNYFLKLGTIGGTGIIVGFVADIVLLYTFLSQGEKDALARQVQELEHLRQVEQLHYQSIEMRREELAKIRHDFNNQLSTALALIQRHDTEQAGQMMDKLKEDISRTKEYVWCGEPVVNAVLGEQAAVCEAEGIALQVEIKLGNVGGIQPVHLCSIFSNLLDNARRGAGQCAEGERRIALNAVQHGEYIHIKVENSAVMPVEKLRKGHGYGQEILRDIAVQYNGEFRKEWKDGIYSAYLSLECRN